MTSSPSRPWPVCSGVAVQAAMSSETILVSGTSTPMIRPVIWMPISSRAEPAQRIQRTS